MTLARTEPTPYPRSSPTAGVDWTGGCGSRGASAAVRTREERSRTIRRLRVKVLFRIAFMSGSIPQLPAASQNFLLALSGGSIPGREKALVTAPNTLPPKFVILEQKLSGALPAAAPRLPRGLIPHGPRDALKLVRLALQEVERQAALQTQAMVEPAQEKIALREQPVFALL